MRNVLKLRGTMLFGKSSMRIGMKVAFSALTLGWAAGRASGL